LVGNHVAIFIIGYIKECSKKDIMLKAELDLILNTLRKLREGYNIDEAKN